MTDNTARLRELAEMQGPVRVVVTDVATGRVLDDKVISNDYAVITQGNRYVKNVQMMGKPPNMTHMVCIAVANAALAKARREDGDACIQRLRPMENARSRG